MDSLQGQMVVSSTPKALSNTEELTAFRQSSTPDFVGFPRKEPQKGWKGHLSGIGDKNSTTKKWISGRQDWHVFGIWLNRSGDLYT